MHFHHKNFHKLKIPYNRAFYLTSRVRSQ